jgi:hypothetical protein
MARLIAVLVSALLALCAGNAIARAAYVHNLNGTATATVGTAERALRIGDILASGTTVTTGDKSTAIIKFEDGQVMALAGRTSFRIVDYRYNKRRVADSSAVFSLLRGGLRFISGVIGSTNRNNFRLTAGAATIGIRGSSAAILFDERTQQVIAAVYAGAIEMVTPQGKALIGAGNFSTYTPGQVPAVTAPQPTAQAAAAVQEALGSLLAQVAPVNLPVVLETSAAAAAAVAQARLLAAQAAADPDNQPLQQAAQQAAKLAEDAVLKAIQAAQLALEEALKGGAVLPELDTLPPPAADDATKSDIKQLITPGGIPCSVASCN